MAEAPIIPRRRRVPVKPERGFTHQRGFKVKGESIAIPASEEAHPMDLLVPVIDWFNVVDGFRFSTHRNTLPRWAFLVLALIVIALT